LAAPLEMLLSAIAKVMTLSTYLKVHDVHLFINTRFTNSSCQKKIKIKRFTNSLMNHKLTPLPSHSSTSRRRETMYVIRKV